MFPIWFVLAATGLFGAVLGSFLNVCVYRIPRGLSVVSPPSACPSCGKRIAPYDNVPVVAWFWLAGKCRSCRSAISPRYPVVEAVTAAVFLGLGWRYGLRWELLPALYFAAAMIAVTLIDFDARIIPDAITLPGIPLGILAALVTPVTVPSAVIGAALGFALLWGLGWAYRRATGIDGMGGGDVKLAAMLGAFLGWPGLILTVFGASFLGTVTGVAMMARGRGGRRTALPFGTFLAPVGLLVYVWGPQIIHWYLAFSRR